MSKPKHRNYWHAKHAMLPSSSLHMRALTYNIQPFAYTFDWPHAMALLQLRMWRNLCASEFDWPHVICERSHTSASFLPPYLTGHTRWPYFGFSCGWAFVVTLAFCRHFWLATCDGKFRLPYVMCCLILAAICVRSHMTAFCLHIWLAACDGFTSASHAEKPLWSHVTSFCLLPPCLTGHMRLHV